MTDFNARCPCPPGEPCPPGGCCVPWPVDCRCLPPDWDCDNLTPDQQRAVAAASTYLSAWSGGWYGQCQRTVRPCAPSGSICSGPCSCGWVCRVKLDFPVTGICSAHIGGEPIPIEELEVDRHLFLSWLGNQCFPRCNDMSVADGQPGSWSITYLQGWPPGPGAAQAVAGLAYYLLDSCTPGEGVCLPPPGTTRIVRTGVSIDLDKDTDSARDIPNVKRFLSMVNPTGRRSPLMGWSPDEPATSVTTWAGRAGECW